MVTWSITQGMLGMLKILICPKGYQPIRPYFPIVMDQMFVPPNSHGEGLSLNLMEVGM